MITVSFQVTCRENQLFACILLWLKHASLAVAVRLWQGRSVVSAVYTVGITGNAERGNRFARVISWLFAHRGSRVNFF